MNRQYPEGTNPFFHRQSLLALPDQYVVQFMANPLFGLSLRTKIPSESELQAIYEIGPDRAAQIIQLRPFFSYNDMKRIKGIGDARAEAIKNQGIVCFD